MLLVVASLAGAATATQTSLPVLTVDLDLPPAQRFRQAAEQYNATLWAALASFADDPTYAAIFKLADGIFTGNGRPAWYPEDQWEELHGLHEVTKVPMGVGVAINILYDVTAFAKGDNPACTSIVAQSASGAIVHGRNLDYVPAIHDAMATLAVRMRWTRGGRELFESVSFFGTTGFNTAVRPGAYSFSQDERDQGKLASNLFDLFVAGRVATFAELRSVAATAPDYATALELLSNTPLAAPSYFVLAGPRPGEGALITRDRAAAADVRMLNASAGRWYLAETNYDWWRPPKPGDDRRAPAHRALDALGAGGVSSAVLLAVLSDRRCNQSAGERPVLNSHTVYTAIMRPALPAGGAGGAGAAMETTLRMPAATEQCEPPLALVEANDEGRGSPALPAAAVASLHAAAANDDDEDDASLQAAVANVKADSSANVHAHADGVGNASSQAGAVADSALPSVAVMMVTNGRPEFVAHALGAIARQDRAAR